MNKEYIYTNGNVIIRDENSEYKEIEYKDGLEKVLEQENLVETIQNKIAVLKDKIHTKIKKPSAIGYTIVYILGIIIMHAIFDLCLHGIYFEGSMSFLGIKSATNSATLYFSVIYTFYHTANYINAFVSYKRACKKRKVNEFELYTLEKLLTEEKEELEKLNAEKTVTHMPKELKVSKVNDKELLEGLASYLEYYNKMSYDINKCLKKYSDYEKCYSELREKGYESEDISLAKDYIEKQGLTLAKRK